MAVQFEDNSSMVVSRLEEAKAVALAAMAIEGKALIQE